MDQVARGSERGMYPCMNADLDSYERSLGRVKAAAQHVRVLMLRERSPDHIENEVHNLVQLVEDEFLETSFEVASEILAMLSTDELDRLGEMALERRREMVERKAAKDQRLTA